MVLFTLSTKTGLEFHQSVYKVSGGGQSRSFSLFLKILHHHYDFWKNAGPWLKGALKYLKYAVEHHMMLRPRTPQEQIV